VLFRTDLDQKAETRGTGSLKSRYSRIAGVSLIVAGENGRAKVSHGSGVMISLRAA
jgi:hypothetical protein